MNGPRSVVVVVDDSLVVRSLLTRQLQDHGHLVVAVADGESGLVACAASPPDVVLLDLNLPGISGYEVLSGLRAARVTADIPVIILTERQTAEDAAYGLELGAHDYLRKPVHRVELIARVDAALRLKHAEDGLRQRNEQLEHANQTDYLSGLANRRHMDGELTRSCAGARRDGGSLGVLIVDLDAFKQINDMAGHVAGDAVLREVGRRIAAALQAEYTAGRWGGDEFLILMPGSDAAGLARAGELVRQSVKGSAIVIAPGRELVVTVSVGGALYGAASADDFVRAADAALYEAKHNGRDAVVIAEPGAVAEDHEQNAALNHKEWSQHHSPATPLASPT